MEKILNLTFPRSGHHLLVDILKSYFNDKMNYCEFYNSNNNCGCFGGTNPGNQLCVKEKTNFQKHHDFEKLFHEPRVLTVPKDLDRKYLILYRSKYPALVSWYEMFLDEEDNKKVEHSEEDFRNFMNWATNFYDKWIEKWVEDKEIENKLVITYEELTSNTVEIVAKVVEFSEERISRSRIKDAIIDVTVKEKRDITNSGFYNILKNDFIDQE